MKAATTKRREGKKKGESTSHEKGCVPMNATQAWETDSQVALYAVGAPAQMVLKVLAGHPPTLF